MKKVKNIIRRSLTIVLAAALLAAFIPETAFASAADDPAFTEEWEVLPEEEILPVEDVQEEPAVDEDVEDAQEEPAVDEDAVEEQEDPEEELPVNEEGSEDQTAYFDEPDPNATKTIVWPSSKAITDPVFSNDTTTPWTGSYVWYGSYDGNAVRYRVLKKYDRPDDAFYPSSGYPDEDKEFRFDRTRATMFLDCDRVLFNYTLGDGWRTTEGWRASTLRNDLNGGSFLDKDGVFSGVEKDAIIVSRESFFGKSYADYLKEHVSNYGTLNEKVFILGYSELNRSLGGKTIRNEKYGYSYTGGKSNKYLIKTGLDGVEANWWLRDRDYTSRCPQYVTNDGKINNVTNGTYGVSPAFNLNAESIVFESLISTGSSPAAGENGAEYTLTLLDEGLEASVTDTPTYTYEAGSASVTIPYAVADYSEENDPNTLVAVVTPIEWEGKCWRKGYLDTLYKNNSVHDDAYPLQVETMELTENTGTFTFDLAPSFLKFNKWSDPYHIYLFAMDENSAYETDYAGIPDEVRFTRKDTVSDSVGVRQGLNTIELGSYLVENSKISVAEVEDPDGILAGDPTLDGTELKINVKGGIVPGRQATIFVLATDPVSEPYIVAVTVEYKPSNNSFKGIELNLYANQGGTASVDLSDYIAGGGELTLDGIEGYNKILSKGPVVSGKTVSVSITENASITSHVMLNLKFAYENGKDDLNIKLTVYPGKKTVDGLRLNDNINPTPPSNPEDKWHGNYVFYGINLKQAGSTTITPTRYRVLDRAATGYDPKDPSAKTLLLECDTFLLFSSIGKEDVHSWLESAIRSQLNGEGFLTKNGNFTAIEQGTMVESTIGSHPLMTSGGTVNVPAVVKGWNPDYTALDHDKVFLLDAEDLCNRAYGYDNSEELWSRLRADTPPGKHGRYILLRQNGGDKYTCIDNLPGGQGNDPTRKLMQIESDDCISVSPAFNVDLSSVVLTFYNNRGESDNAINGYTLALLDPDLQFGLTEPARTYPVDGKTRVAIPYSLSDVSSTSDPDCIMAVVTKGTWTENGWSEGAKLLQSAKLTVENGTGYFDLKDGLPDDYNIYVFAMDENAVFETSYASEPVPVGIRADVKGYNGIYDGQAHGITVDILNSVSGATVKYGRTEGRYDLTESPKITNVSESPLTVYYQITAPGYTAVTGSATVTIEEADPTVTLAPAAKEGLKYTGVDQALVSAGHAEGGILTYAVTGKGAETPDADQFSASLPKAKNAGEYAVWYIVKGDENHKDTDPQKVADITIGAAIHNLPSYYITVPANRSSDQTFTLPELPEGEKYEYLQMGEGQNLIEGTPQINGRTLTFRTKSQNVGTKATIAIKVDVPDGADYDDYLVGVNVTAGDTTEAGVSIEGGDRTVTYGDTGIVLKGVVTTPGDGTGVWSWSSKTPGVAEIDNTGAVTIQKAGKTYITATYTSDTATGSAVICLTVEKRVLGVAWSSKNFVFDGRSHHPTAELTGVPEGETCSVTVSGEKTNAGTGYIAKASLGEEDTPKYEISDENKTCAFSIAKANLQDAEITLGEALTYDGTAQMQDVLVKFGENVIDASNVEITGNTATDAGEYALTVKATAGGNCIGQVTKEFTVAKKQTEVTATIAAQTFTGNAINPEFTVKDTDGLTLACGRDYLYEVTDNVNAGTGKVRIMPTETGNYSFNEKVEEFTINAVRNPEKSFFITRYCESFENLEDYIDFSEYLPEDCGAIFGSIGYNGKNPQQNDHIFGFTLGAPNEDFSKYDKYEICIHAQVQNYDWDTNFYITYMKQSMSLCEKGSAGPVASKKLTPGKTFTLVPKFENATNTNVTWTSSDPNVATVDQSGKVKAIAPGYTMITAAGEKLSGQCSVVVTEAVTSLTLDQKKYVLGAGEKMILSAAILPFTAPQEIKWSTSNMEVAIVCDAVSGNSLRGSETVSGKIKGKVYDVSGSQTVMIKAFKAGSAKITAEAADGSGKKAVCNLTVGAAVPDTFSITSKGNATDLIAGKTLAMNVNWPENKKPANAEVTWSVVAADGETKEASEIATITPKGVLTGLSEGKIKVKATSTAARNNGSAIGEAVSEEIMVYVPVKNAALNMNSGTVSLKGGSDGKTLQLEPVITSAVPGQDPTGVSVSWSVAEGDKEYLTVSETGLVTANSAAADNVPVVAKVTAYNGFEKTLICKVSVKDENPLKGIKISAKKLSVGEGNTANLTATLDPVNPDVGGYTWSSSDLSVATVDENGKIVAVKPGKATITATANGTVTVRGEEKNPAVSCEVTVIPSVTGIEIKNLSVTETNRLAVGKTLSAKTVFLSSDGKNKAKTTLAWTSSDPAVATVTPKGVVKAVSNGTATITATSTDVKAEGGTTPAISFDVEVYAPVTKLAIDKSKLTLGTQKGAQYGKIGVSALLPVNATDPSIEWTVNNENVSLAAIPQDGLAKTGIFNTPGKAVTTKGGEALAIRALIPGTVKLTGITTDGTKKKVSCTITIRGTVTGLKLQTTTTKDKYGQVEFIQSGKYRSRIKAGGRMSLVPVVDINGIAGDETDKNRKKLYTDYKKCTDASVSYRSTRPDVVKVDKGGKITVDKKAKNGQMATIYVTAADGKTVQIRITVVE
ncbi:MAG: Ig-like domain-containing protein [Lachnospiraceae bacterium]|nr:Ig-like domain-containing protein [Lachnospiraceae bacterium]